MKNTDLLTMDQIVDLIATYKGEAIPDDLFDAMIALLKKVNDSRSATHIVDELTQGITNAEFTVDAGNRDISIGLTVNTTMNSTLYKFLYKKMCARPMAHFTF